jgi:hypothetical protein
VGTPLTEDSGLTRPDSKTNHGPYPEETSPVKLTIGKTDIAVHLTRMLSQGDFPQAPAKHGTDERTNNATEKNDAKIQGLWPPTYTTGSVFSILGDFFAFLGSGESRCADRLEEGF